MKLVLTFNCASLFSSSLALRDCVGPSLCNFHCNISIHTKEFFLKQFLTYGARSKIHDPQDPLNLHLHLLLLLPSHLHLSSPHPQHSLPLLQQPLGFLLRQSEPLSPSPHCPQLLCQRCLERRPNCLDGAVLLTCISSDFDRFWLRLRLRLRPPMGVLGLQRSSTGLNLELHFGGFAVLNLNLGGGGNG